MTVPQRPWGATAPFRITSSVWRFFIYQELLLSDLNLKLFPIRDTGFTIFKLCSNTASQDDLNYVHFKINLEVFKVLVPNTDLLFTVDFLQKDTSGGTN